MQVRVEQGPKGKKCVAYAIDWPGLERNGKTEELALARLAEYLTRYAPIARDAGLESEFAEDGDIDVVDRYVGTGSTDFWGISFASAPAEIEQPYAAGEFERHLALLESAWRSFDAIAAAVSSELKKGPRGGGRDRDNIIRHVLFNEADWAKGIGVNSEPESLMDTDGRKAYRDAYIAALRHHHVAGKMAKTWTLSFLVRHSAYHTLDHAWEMQDKDLTN